MALLRSVATVGSLTLVSRVFGFLRDILTAAVLGAGPVADAFFVAQRLPNLFRSLFAEGAFSAAFVPLAVGFPRRGRQAGGPRLRRGSLRGSVRGAARLRRGGRSIDAVGDERDRAGLRRRARQVRAGRRPDPHHLPLSAVHLADRAAGRVVERGRPVRGAGRDADPAEPVSDRGAAADGAVRLVGRPCPGVGADRRRRGAVPLADGLVRARRGGRCGFGCRA